MGFAAKDNPFTKLESRFRIRQTSSNNPKPGVHSTGSYHYKRASWGGRKAKDYGTSLNSLAKLRTVGLFLAGWAKVGGRYRGRRIREVFGPFPFYVKDGRVYRGRFPNHGDHIHIAFSE